MENFNLTFPIDLVKKEERIVSGIATADNIDKVGDIVEFDASQEAFANWEGNIREMHAPIAVGKAINYEPVEITGPDGKVYKGIRVDAYISKGAQNTWEKVLDGTLRAFSIGGKIIEKIQTAEKMNNGRPVHRIKKYMLGELSLVDNPANAIAVVDIVKKDQDGLLKYALSDLTTEIVDSVIEKAKQPLKDPKGGLTAAGRRHFKETEGANLKPGVKGPANTPEKMRRKGSFLTRFFTNPSGPMKDEKGRPTRLALSAAAWGEPVPQDRSDAAKLAAKGRRLLERYAKLKNKSIDDILAEDEDILSKEMQFFVEQNFIDLIKDIELDEIDLLIEKKTPANPKLYEKLKNEAKRKFNVYPSLYANMWLAREYEKRGGTYKMEKEGEVTTSNMDAGIKNPTQGFPRRKKKEKKMKKSVEAKPQLIEALQEVLAHNVVFYFSAHRAHWNVQGPDFSEYHELFGEIYEDAYGSIDPFAENIRKSGGFPKTLSEMEDMSEFEDATSTTDAISLATDLYEKNLEYIDILKEAFDVASNLNEQGIANFIADRIDMHQKWSWQLNASLGGVEEIPVETEEMEDETSDQEAPESENSSPMTMQDLMNLLGKSFDDAILKAMPTKREAGEDFPASAFAYVPDPQKPSTWKLRLWESVSAKETPAQVGRAVAALGAGFRGNKVEIPSSDLSSVKSKVASAWRKVNKDKKPSEMPSVLKNS